jgi:tRNA threonylcarbamoyladenosine biosynthesis protein TsaB
VHILAIETATALGGVALLEGERLVRSIEEEVPRGHLEWLVPAIQRLLREAGWEPPQVEAIAVSVGPGGFTSLRIGIATAVAWGRAREVPVVSVSTLAVLAAGVESKGNICAMFDARHGEVAAAVFANGSEPRRLLDDLVAPPDQVLQRLPAQGPITFAGDALAKYESEVTSRLGERAVIAPREQWAPRVVHVGRLGWRRLMRGERDDLYHVWPVYARVPVS